MFDIKSLNLLSDECYENYFVDFNYFDAACFKALLSKGLGIAIVAGSVLVKLPQILKISTNKSAQGINAITVFIDLLVLTLYMSYNYAKEFPFSAYGDSFFLAIQTAIIGYQVFYYEFSVTKAYTFAIAYIIMCYLLLSGATPIQFLTAVQCLNIPVILVGRMFQANTNYQNKSTGQLSAATLSLTFGGSLARIFTSIQETGDNLVILTSLAAAFANAIIFVQLILYWNNAPKSKVSKAKKTK